MGKPIGISKTLVAPGNGRDRPRRGDVVAMSYTMSLLDSTAIENGFRGTVFDSSASRGQDYEVSIGMGRIILGWDEAILNVDGGMTLGEVAAFKIPSEYAYGKNGFPGLIPPYTDLVLDGSLALAKAARYRKVHDRSDSWAGDCDWHGCTALELKSRISHGGRATRLGDVTHADLLDR